MLNKDYYNNVSVVLVTYNPNKDSLQVVIQAISDQVSNIFIVDNGSSNFSSDWFDKFKSCQMSEKLHVLPQEENLGIAAAQNIGIKQAMKLDADFVLLLDQDSIPDFNMVKELISVMDEKSSEGYKIAAVGAHYVDERNTDRSSFSRLSGMCLVKENPVSNRVVLTDFVISSGSLISLKTLHSVGYMNEALFIDQVDIEWGLRAKSLGYQSFGSCNAVMAHSLGEEPLVFLGRKFLNHNPLRHYYIFRNAVWLISKKYVSIGWKVRFAIVILIRYFLYPLWVTPRFTYLKMMTLGIWHGLIGRMGKL
ncbi:MAG: glycosyltransferase family 2 protein [Methylococcales bacterium]